MQPRYFFTEDRAFIEETGALCGTATVKCIPYQFELLRQVIRQEYGARKSLTAAFVRLCFLLMAK